MLVANFLGVDGLRLEQRTIPEPGSNQVLIKVMSAGICGTDAHIIKGESASTPPVILGHEYAGEIIKLGQGVTAFELGDRVSVDPNILCGTCIYCHAGKGHLCQNLTALGVDIDGGFAQYGLVPDIQAHLIPPSMSYEEGAFVEPVACCIRGLQQVQIQPGDEVAILGCGPIGLILLQLVIAVGGRVTVGEPQRDKWALARELGASRAVLPDELPEDTFDAVIEASGAKTAIEQTLKIARRGASIVWFGVSPKGVMASIEPHEVFRKELRIAGSFINPNTHARAIKLIATGAVKVAPLISHRFPLEDVEAALNLHASGAANKIMIIPSEV